ncbi:HEAT repeat domain-containing protein [Sulfurimonas sp.]|uniref:HEAT repeat domain-containing protein n=1 Tax=Sulfurimonas sp. TaxID=2022749 RepID=UPI002600BC9F|nr:HEAT repeat domain-containing protein [Sulfurimonas sp.]MBT5934182.1 hypothetical protein [Sulfurimonas sp.]
MAKNNPLALEELLIAYSNYLSNPKLEKQLSQIVSQIKDPKVENFAQDLATSEDRQQNIIGFDLLGELQIPNEKTLQISTEALSQFSGDKELTLSALHAMPHLNLPQSKNNEIVMLLSELSISQDEAVRSESIITLGQWAKSELEISAVVDALSSSTNDDRISAAIALEQSHVVGNSLKTVLLEKLEDTAELWEVRAMSANSLERFDLNNNEFSILENFRKNQVGGVKN